MDPRAATVVTAILGATATSEPVVSVEGARGARVAGQADRAIPSTSPARTRSRWLAARVRRAPAVPAVPVVSVVPAVLAALQERRACPRRARPAATRAGTVRL